MNYLLNPDQLAFHDTAQRFLSERSDSLFLHRIADRHDGWQTELQQLWNDFSGLGFAGLLVPEAFGGIGMNLFDATLISEALGASAAPLPLLGHHLCIMALVKAGSEEQRAEWLPLLASGEVIGTVALLDAKGGYQPQHWLPQAGCSARRTLGFVPQPGTRVATLMLVGLANGELGIIRPDAPSLATSERPCIDPCAFLADIEVDETDIQRLPGGAQAARGILDAGYALLAADAYGGISRCVELSTTYAKVREQFGVPIGQFQAVKHQLADMALDGEPNRPLVWHAAQCVDENFPNSTRRAMLAKAHLSDAYLRTARRTIELHGGFGYTWEADMHLYLKRAMFGSAYLGSANQVRKHLAVL